jgi:hypothetical protein
LHLIGEKNGRPIHIFFTRPVLVWLSDVDAMTREIALTLALDHRAALASAAGHAAKHAPADAAWIVVALRDIVAAELELLRAAAVEAAGADIISASQPGRTGATFGSRGSHPLTPETWQRRSVSEPRPRP